MDKKNPENSQDPHDPKEKEFRRMTKSELTERLFALQKPSSLTKGRSARELRENEFRTVVHELEVYQIELEMQNRELRESRLALEESHDRYVNLYDFAPVGYVTLTAQGMIKEINLTAAGMLGIERHWLMGHFLAPRILASDLSTFRAHLKKAAENKGKVTSALNLIRPDKQTIPVELSSVGYTDPLTGEGLTRTAITDMTERKLAEDERERFFEVSSDLLCLINAKGYFERINPAWEKLLGYSLKELNSRPFIDFLHPEDRDRTHFEFERVLSGKKLKAQFQNRYIKKDGTEVWLSWSGVMSGTTFFGISRDTTTETLKKVAVENQYAWLQDLVRSLPIPFVLADIKTGKVLSESIESEILLRDIPRSQLEDLTQDQVYFTDSQGLRLKMADWPVYRATRGETCSGEEFALHTPLRTIHILVWTRIIPAKYGHEAMVLVVFHNIDTLKLKEVSLQNAIHDLNEEKLLRERFVSALSHDLRSPLTSAKMGIQLLARKGYVDAKGAQISGNVARSLDRINHMIEDLLDANRIHAGEPLPIQVKRFDLSSMIHATVEDLCTVHGSRITVVGKKKVFGDWSKNHLQRVVENLINNAVKYGSPEKQITVTINEVDKNQVSMEVHNYGNPISQEDQKTLFEQFRRTNNAQASDKKGWGVGLTLVRGIVEAHGGEITVNSTRDAGTVFRVVLPS